jgi:hypothetical protein
MKYCPNLVILDRKQNNFKFFISILDRIKKTSHASVPLKGQSNKQRFSVKGLLICFSIFFNILLFAVPHLNEYYRLQVCHIVDHILECSTNCPFKLVRTNEKVGGSRLMQRLVFGSTVLQRLDLSCIQAPLPHSGPT